MYIGSTKNFQERWAQHKRLLQRGLHSNRHLQNAWNKDGEDLFEFSEVEYVDKDWEIREQYYTDLWNPEYAIQKECVTSSLGIVRTEEQKKKISNSLMGENNPNYGKRFSEEHKRRMSEALVGNKNALGCRRSEETRRKMSKAQRGLKRELFSDEHRRKIGVASSIYMKGKKLSEETKLKISAKLKGRVISEEIRQNMRVPKRAKRK